MLLDGGADGAAKEQGGRTCSLAAPVLVDDLLGGARLAGEAASYLGADGKRSPVLVGPCLSWTLVPPGATLWVVVFRNRCRCCAWS
eukprot:2845873-Rhodomonas_salina.1